MAVRVSLRVWGTNIQFSAMWPAFHKSVGHYLKYEFNNFAPDSVRSVFLQLVSKQWEHEFKPRITAAGKMLS